MVSFHTKNTFSSRKKKKKKTEKKVVFFFLEETQLLTETMAFTSCSILLPHKTFSNRAQCSQQGRLLTAPEYHVSFLCPEDGNCSQ